MLKTCDICKHEFEDTLSYCPRKELHALPGSSDPLIGTIINDRFQLTEHIGKGAMGAVYKATQLNDGGEVAIKVLHTHLSSDPESLKRFQAEAKAASSLMHPHIVRLYEIGVIPGVGQPYIAMEFVAGKTLSDLLREKKALSTKEALPIIRQVCEALAEAHSNGVLHRDIKPANIMLMNRFGQENFVVVLDFSIAKVIQKVSDVDSTTPGLILGSPAYMSPERFMGKGGDFRSDIYSMGIIMFQLLAGRGPFKANDLFSLMNEHVGTVPPRVKDIRPDADVPESLEESIARALAKKPEDRHSNMKQLLTEINFVYQQISNSTSHQPILQTVQYPAGNIENSGTGPALSASDGSPSGSRPGVRPLEQNGKIFDIDPSYTPNVTPSLGVPNFNTTQVRKALGIDQSAPQSPLKAELTQSDRWDKSLIVRNTNEREQRKSIRNKTSGNRISLQLIALIIVVLIGIGAMAARFLSPTNTHDRVVQMIKAHQFEEASAVIESWAPNARQGVEQELYADGLLQLGRAFERDHSHARAASCYARVPQGTKAEPEALNLLKKLPKPKVE